MFTKMPAPIKAERDTHLAAQTEYASHFGGEYSLTVI